MKVENTPSLKHPEVLFMSLFGIGFLPKMPGTYGSLATLPLLYLLSLSGAPFFIFIPFLVIATVISCYIAEITQKKFNVHDPSWIVMDEVLGMLTAWLFIAGDEPNFYALAALFALFRFFDIFKIWPASYFDKQVTHGMGTILDDIISGVFAGVILKLTFYYLSA
jgi:phosphatidylglycerophosphatase A